MTRVALAIVVLVGAGLMVRTLTNRRRVVGTGVGIGVTRYLKAMLHKVRADDPVTRAGVGALVAVCLVPARRATSVDPLVALRYG